MAKSISTRFTITTTGDGVTSEWKPAPMSNSAGAAGGPVGVQLAAGDNYISVPTGAMGFTLKPLASSVVVKRLKHYPGETGFSIRTGEPASIPLPTGVATLMINASGVEVIDIHWT